MGAVRRWAVPVVSVAAVCALLTLVDAPSPLLFGGLLGALMVTLAGHEPPALPRGVFLAAQAVIGVSVAAQVDGPALRAFGSDWPAILLVTVATLVVSVVVGQLLRLHGVSAVTATFATVAGGASGMTALARDLGADDRVVTVVQYLRVLAILATLPVVVSVVFHPDRHAATVAAPHAGVADYAFVALAAGLGTGAGLLVRLPSPALLGALLVGMVLALTPPFADRVVPAWVQGVGFLLVGAQVGLRFTRDALAQIGRMLPTALVSIAVVVAACAGLGVLLARLTGESALDAYLATTPGGLPAVLATSTETSGNVTFVTAVQLIRLLLVLLLAPVVARLLRRRS